MRLLSLYLLLTASFLSSHELQKFNLSLDFLETDESKEIEMNIIVPRNLYRPSLEENLNNGLNFDACNEKDFDLVNKTCIEAAEACISIIEEGTKTAMEKYNGDKNE